MTEHGPEQQGVISLFKVFLNGTVKDILAVSASKIKLGLKKAGRQWKLWMLLSADDMVLIRMSTEKQHIRIMDSGRSGE